MIPHLAEWLWFILGDFSAKSSFSGILMLLIICNLRKFSLTASIRERYLVMSVSNCIDHCLDFYRSLDWKLCFQTCMSVLRRVPHSLVPGPFPGGGRGRGDVEWGIPPPPQTGPGQDMRPRLGYPLPLPLHPRHDTPQTGYAADGTPLAVTHEDFLVFSNISRISYVQLIKNLFFPKVILEQKREIFQIYT